MSFAAVIVSLLAAILVVLTVYVATEISNERRVRQRLIQAGGLEAYYVPDADEERGILGNWLFISGFRRAGTQLVFIGSTLFLFLLGLAAMLWIEDARLVQLATYRLSAFPGGLGNAFIPPVLAVPWLLCIVPPLLPAYVVHRVRKARIREIEKDLILLLELLATLSEAGMGFDASLAKILESQRQDKPLTVEMQLFVKELNSGRSRVNALRRLARRTEVLSVSIFVSALVQMEQLGAALTATLRIQADDLRSRRRDRALEWAMSAPTRLILPMVICFLPGIFVFALGPSYYTILEFVQTLVSKLPR